jgi:hypothetical protein
MATKPNEIVRVAIGRFADDRVFEGMLHNAAIIISGHQYLAHLPGSNRFFFITIARSYGLVRRRIEGCAYKANGETDSRRFWRRESADSHLTTNAIQP